MPSRSRRRRLIQDRGQASLEWLAVVALVASLLALGAGLAQADAVGRRVTREMARALCLVRDGDCRRDQEPCVLASEGTSSHVEGSIRIFRLGEDHYGVIERRSDGTYAVTVGGKNAAGLSGLRRAKGSARVAGIDVSAGGTITASILAGDSGARTWIAGSDAEAEALLASSGYTRSPDLTSDGFSWLSRAGASARVTALLHADAGSAAVSFGKRSGSVTDHRTGRRTIYVSADAGASAEALVLGSAGAEGAGEIYAVETSSDGRPLALTITTAGLLTRSGDLPAVVQPVAGRLAPTGAGRYEVTAALDLTEPAAFAAASGLFDAIARKVGRARPSAVLRRLVEASGTVEARILAADDATTFSLDLPGGSFKAAVERHERRLLAATSRGLDGQWIVREDCLRQA